MNLIGYRIKTQTVNQAFYRILEILLLKGNQVEIEEDKKGSRSGGKTIELQNLLICIEDPKSEDIEIPTELSAVTKKFLDGMLYKDTQKPQSRRVIEQKEEVMELLRQRPHTRKASIAVWERSDLTASYSVCIAYLQFIIRNERLHQTAVFRSHDIWNGFLYNTKGNLLLQEEIADALNKKIGTYTELAVSAHIYAIDEEKARTYLINSNRMV